MDILSPIHKKSCPPPSQPGRQMNYSMMVSAQAPSRIRSEEREKYKERILWNSLRLCLVRVDGIPFSANSPISAICLLIMSAGSLLIKCVHQRERERSLVFVRLRPKWDFEQVRRRVSPFSSIFPACSQLLGPEFDPVHVRLSDIKDDGGACLTSIAAVTTPSRQGCYQPIRGISEDKLTNQRHRPGSRA